RPSPYISAVSISVRPRSRPRRMVAISSARVAWLSPMFQVPWPSAGTASPPGRVTIGNAAWLAHPLAEHAQDVVQRVAVAIQVEHRREPTQAPARAAGCLPTEQAAEQVAEPAALSTTGHAAQPAALLRRLRRGAAALLLRDQQIGRASCREKG